MLRSIGTTTVVLLGVCLSCTTWAPAQSSSDYSRCVAQAEQQSGWHETSNSAQKAPLRGAAAGAAGGAFLGGITGGNAGTGAAIGAAFGAIAGGVRKKEVQSARQNEENNFYNDLNSCLSRPN